MKIIDTIRNAVKGKPQRVELPGDIPGPTTVVSKPIPEVSVTKVNPDGSKNLGFHGPGVPTDPVAELNPLTLDSGEVLVLKAPKPAPRDEFLVKWEHLRGKAILVPKPMVQAIIRFGKLESRVAELEDRLRPLAEEFRAKGNELLEFTAAAVQKHFHKLASDNEGHVRAGRREQIKMLPNREELREQFSRKSVLIKKQQRSIVLSAHPTIIELFDTLGAAARDLAVDLESDEREAAGKWGVEFSPSRQLVTLAYFAIEGANHGKQAGHPGAALDFLSS